MTSLRPARRLARAIEGVVATMARAVLRRLAENARPGPGSEVVGEAAVVGAAGESFDPWAFAGIPPPDLPGSVFVANPLEIFSEEEWAAATATLSGEVLGVMDASAEGVLVQAGYAFDVANPDMAEAVAAHVNGISSWGPEMRLHVANVVQTGVAEGHSIDQIAEGLVGAAGAPLSAQRARLIARTEAISASNAGAVAGFAKLPFISAKRWLTTLDGRERFSHRAANGQTVPIDGNFTVGGQETPYPGWPGLTVGERSNCRCSLIALEADPNRVIAPGVSASSVAKVAPPRRPDELSIEDEAAIGAAGPAIRERLTEMFTARRAVDGRVTGMIENLARSSGGRMEGLDFRLKSPTGVLEKIERLVRDDPGLTPFGAAGQITDSLRYTMLLPETGISYLQGAASTITEMRAAGFRTIDVDNYWRKGGGYKGINATLVDPDSGLTFELQFHTDASWATKSATHGDYQFLREGGGSTPERFAAHRRMQRASDEIPFPEGASNLGTARWRPWTGPIRDLDDLAGSRRFGSVQDGNAWGGDKFAAWSDSRPQLQADAISSYTGSTYDTLNRALRAGEVLDGRVARVNRDLHEALWDSQLSEAVVVTRGIALETSPHAPLAVRDALAQLRDAIEDRTLLGELFTDKGYMSTSVGPTPFASETNLLMEMHLPAGTRGAYIGRFSSFGSEAEFLLPPNTSLRVLEFRSDRHVVMELVDQVGPDGMAFAPLPPVRLPPPVAKLAKSKWAEMTPAEVGKLDWDEVLEYQEWFNKNSVAAPNLGPGPLPAALRSQVDAYRTYLKGEGHTASLDTLSLLDQLLAGDHFGPSLEKEAREWLAAKKVGLPGPALPVFGPLPPTLPEELAKHIATLADQLLLGPNDITPAALSDLSELGYFGAKSDPLNVVYHAYLKDVDVWTKAKKPELDELTGWLAEVSAVPEPMLGMPSSVADALNAYKGYAKSVGADLGSLTDGGWLKEAYDANLLDDLAKAEYEGWIAGGSETVTAVAQRSRTDFLRKAIPEDLAIQNARAKTTLAIGQKKAMLREQEGLLRFWEAEARKPNPPYYVAEEIATAKAEIATLKSAVADLSGTPVPAAPVLTPGTTVVFPAPTMASTETAITRSAATRISKDLAAHPGRPPAGARKLLLPLDDQAKALAAEIKATEAVLAELESLDPDNFGRTELVDHQAAIAALRSDLDIAEAKLSKLGARASAPQAVLPATPEVAALNDLLSEIAFLEEDVADLRANNAPAATLQIYEKALAFQQARLAKAQVTKAGFTAGRHQGGIMTMTVLSGQTFQVDDPSTGAMIALFPDDPAMLAIPGGDPPEQLHVTLLYLGDLTDSALRLDDPFVQARITQIVGGVAANIPALRLQAFGRAELNSHLDGPTAQVLTVGGEHLEALRDEILEALDDAELEYQENHPTWFAHLTLAYGLVGTGGAEEVDGADIDARVGMEWISGAVTVAFGATRHPYLLLGPEPEQPTEEDGPNAVPTGAPSSVASVLRTSTREAAMHISTAGTTGMITVSTGSTTNGRPAVTGSVKIAFETTAAELVPGDAVSWDDQEGVSHSGVVVTVDAETGDVAVMPDESDPLDEEVILPAAALTKAAPVAMPAETPPGDDEMAASPRGFRSGTPAEFEASLGSGWRGVLVVEGIASGDGRLIELGALGVRKLPLPLTVMFSNPVGGTGHDGAQLAGRVDRVWRDGANIWGEGIFDLGSEVGIEARRLVSDGMLRGVSADMDMVEVDFENPEPPIDAPMDDYLDWDPGLMLVTSGRIMGACLTVFPAFEEATVVLLDEMPAEALAAAAGPPLLGAVARSFLPYKPGGVAMVAGAAPHQPPAAWFAKPDLKEPMPVMVTAEGRVYGHVAAFGSCHIGFAGRCVPVPKSRSAYRHFMTGHVLCAEGTMVKTGRLYLNTVHPNLRLQASDAATWYHNTGDCAADLCAYEDRHGIVVAGAIRPSTTPDQLRVVRGSDISPDWRPINGRTEMIGLLAVNASGFITPAALAASAGSVTRPTIRAGATRALVDVTSGEVLAMVAAGGMRRSRSPIGRRLEHLEAELSALSLQVDNQAQFVADQLRPIRGERAERARTRGAAILKRRDVGR